MEFILSCESADVCLQEEHRMPLASGEGPVGMIVCPSRELARQTCEVIEEYCQV